MLRFVTRAMAVVPLVRCVSFRRMPPFALFIKQAYAKKSPHLQHLKSLSIPRRGKFLGKLYRTLSKDDKAALVKEASKLKIRVRGPKRPHGNSKKAKK